MLAITANVNRNPKVAPKPFEPSDFVPEFFRAYAPKIKRGAVKADLSAVVRALDGR